MIRYRATAYNHEELTFSFTFVAYNWSGINAVARRTLDEIVAADELHRKHGPWSFRNIDRCA